MTIGRERYSAVLWDMDGTLIDSEPLHFRSMVHALSSLGAPVDEGLQAKTTGLSESEVLDFCRRSLGIIVSAEIWTELRNSYYLARSTGLQARRGALPTFLHLAQRGTPQAVVSNSKRIIVDANLQALSFDAAKILSIPSISRDDVRMAKPHPEPYLLAAATLGLPPAECLVIEDSFAGARSGVAAGMRVLFWPESTPEALPHGTVTYIEATSDLESQLRMLLY